MNQFIFLCQSRCLANLIIGIVPAFLLIAPVRADWIDANDPLVVLPVPVDKSMVSQNPPGFAWGRFPRALGYKIALRNSAGAISEYSVGRNWWGPSVKLQPGRYEWRVQPVVAVDGIWSNWRQFDVGSGSVPYIVPDEDELIRRVLAKSRPRSVDFEANQIDAWRSAVSTKRQQVLARLDKEVRGRMGTMPLLESHIPVVAPGSINESDATNAQLVRKLADDESKQLKSAALLWRITGNGMFLAEALKRGNALASLDINGSTSFKRQDQAFREIMWSLAYARDQLDGALSTQEKTTWISAIRRRVNILEADIGRDDWHLQQFPLDSHGVTNTLYLIGTSLMTAGDIPEANSYLRSLLRHQLFFPNPWGGDDGGFANGTAYAEYSAGFIVPLWDVIRTTTGVDPYASSWAKGFLTYLAYFLPPGSLTHMFGDAAERRPFPPALTAFAQRVGDPVAAWYAANLIGDEQALTALTAPMPLLVTTAAQPDSTAIYKSSIGWVAMHSNLQNRDRTSLYFKSSRFGSFNHSHGDQNSFNLTAGGKLLLIDSGWYDWYGSPLWKKWYRQTKAHNAITYDGGKGQVVDGFAELLKAHGKINAALTTPQWDYVEGDATEAYGGALASVIRRIWYLRNQDAVLIWDTVASASPREFEWNMHAAVPFVTNSTNQVSINNQGQLLCITQLLGDDTQFQRRAPIAGRPGVMEDHAFFVLRTAKKSAEFLVLLDIGCKRPSVAMSTPPAARAVAIEGTTVNLTAAARPGLPIKN